MYILGGGAIPTAADVVYNISKKRKQIETDQNKLYKTKDPTQHQLSKLTYCRLELTNGQQNQKQ